MSRVTCLQFSHHVFQLNKKSIYLACHYFSVWKSLCPFEIYIRTFTSHTAVVSNTDLLIVLYMWIVFFLCIFLDFISERTKYVYLRVWLAAEFCPLRCSFYRAHFLGYLIKFDLNCLNKNTFMYFNINLYYRLRNGFSTDKSMPNVPIFHTFLIGLRRVGL